jgi:hypothetical protein
MKAVFALLALATTACANALDARWFPKTTTMTTYTTTTVCPATTTITAKGTTQIVTLLTTSTIVVTACMNCETTVPGPVTTET